MWGCTGQSACYFKNRPSMHYVLQRFNFLGWLWPGFSPIRFIAVLQRLNLNQSVLFGTTTDEFDKTNQSSSYERKRSRNKKSRIWFDFSKRFWLKACVGLDRAKRMLLQEPAVDALCAALELPERSRAGAALLLQSRGSVRCLQLPQPPHRRPPRQGPRGQEHVAGTNPFLPTTINPQPKTLNSKP